MPYVNYRYIIYVRFSKKNKFKKKRKKQQQLLKTIKFYIFHTFFQQN